MIPDENAPRARHAPEHPPDGCVGAVLLAIRRPFAMSDLVEKPLRSEQLVDGALLKAHRDTVRLPDGETAVREWLDHPGASAVVPLFADGSTLLVRQFRYAPRCTFLEVPAGKCDGAEEAPEEVARRELEEETGWKAARLTRLGHGYPCIGYSNEVICFFLAEDLERGTFAPEDGEFLEIERMPFQKALSLARRGELKDMKTVTALFWAERALRLREAPEKSGTLADRCL